MQSQLPPSLVGIQQRFAPGWPIALDIGVGWYELVEALDRSLLEVAPGYRLYQCKSKFGGLRYEIDPGTEDDAVADLTHQLVIDAAVLSESTCESCGQPGSITNINGWIWTLCAIDARKLTQPTDDLELVGTAPAKNCPECARPLEPGHADSSLALVWMCPNHGVMDVTKDPFSGC